MFLTGCLWLLMLLNMKFWIYGRLSPGKTSDKLPIEILNVYFHNWASSFHINQVNHHRHLETSSDKEKQNMGGCIKNLGLLPALSMALNCLYTWNFSKAWHWIRYLIPESPI